MIASELQRSGISMHIVLRFEENVLSSPVFPHSVFEWEKRTAEGEHPELSNFPLSEEARGDRQHVKLTSDFLDHQRFPLHDVLPTTVVEGRVNEAIWRSTLN